MYKFTVLSDSEVSIDIEEILGNVQPEKIDITKLETGTAQARQRGTKVEKDDKLVDAIRRTKGLMHSIIVKQIDGDRYEIVVGQRRWGAYKILAEEDSKYSKIKAYVIKRDLSDDEKKVISFVENYGRNDMQKADYVDVIDYFYAKYNRKITLAAKALGINATTAKKYLTESRLSDNVRQCINEKQFSIDTAIKALEALGDDEESVDDDVLIETAMELKSLQPARRDKVLQKMKTQEASKKDVKKAINEVPTKLIPIHIDATEEMIERLQKFMVKHQNDNESDAASEALDIGLKHDLSEE